MNSLPFAWDWVRPLATPYLRGFRAVPERRGSLRGFWFLHPDSEGSPSIATSASGLPNAAGFFVGYLIDAAPFEFLAPQPPECLAFAFVVPIQGPAHIRRVQENGSLVRKTFDYIRLLTHRPPRFVFHESDLAAMTRHQSMRDWPQEKYEHFSRNFFIESLAWLVRSGIVRKLLTEPVAAGEGKRKDASRRPKTDAQKRRQKSARPN